MRASFSGAARLAIRASVGPIFPPSIPLIIYGTVASVSIEQLFIGGIVHALTVGWDTGDSGGGEVMALGGLVLVAGGTMWNLFTIPLSVREYNEDLPVLTVAPVLDARTRTAGLSLAWRL